MSKDFDLWNDEKKQLELIDSQLIRCKRRQFWLCKIWENIGSEMSKESPFVRPVLILNERLRGDLVLVLPLSTKYREHQKKWYYHIEMSEKYGLNASSYLVLDQVRVISRRRLIRNLNDKTLSDQTYIPLLDTTVFNDILQTLRTSI